MSFILDALRRSEQARRALGETPTDVPLAARAPRLGHAAWRWAVAVLLAANLGVLAWLLWPRASTPALAPAIPPAADSAPAPALPAPRSLEVRPLAGEAPSATDPLSTDESAARGGARADLLIPPRLSEFPALAARLPTLEIQVHSWSADPAQRFAMVNLERYAEGQRLAAGPLLVAIVPEGLVLEHEGVRFLLPSR